ncbi:Putative nucleotide-binding alpha-beta plait domain superfamily, CPSF6/7 family [Septoria linicola]|uniref:Nucleotide-binding alpha-beta plait domain superfamily, CPSF6/7 family n=1 Tax=Septoria linicola TaxID=215465 RepID=A0A9Q9AK03_9PEZI|nr:putative nucleotide-binding alpha-beta plait domain superfamily, CPSF6/7 family [Septoria linicola]USW50797.1 Putative nucleotide-binding alpha-beta plait domain superfamily, CPSF6/7 family [Septoria linicola]
MSGEDDTFDLDIYGDETPAQEKQQQQQQQRQEEENPEDRLDFGDDTYEDSTTQTHQQDQPTNTSQSGQKRKAPDDGHDEHHQAAPANRTPSASARPASATPAYASTEPNATQALKLSELQWWTTEEDLRAFCASAEVEDQLRDIAFGEHKINGKSRGEAYLEFDSPAAASAVKRAIEARDEPTAKNEDATTPAEGKRKNQFQVWYVGLGNPFKGRDSGQATKKDAGAYNAAPSRGGFQRGGFQDRGRGGFQSRAGGGAFPGGRGGFQQNQQQQQGFGGMNGGYGGGYGNANPMMGGMMANPMMAMGMNGMGFRGGFGGYPMRGGFQNGFQGNGGYQGRGR